MTRHSKNQSPRGIPAGTCWLIAGLSVCLSACGGNRTIPTLADLDIPLVYKIDVQQGNVVTQDMLNKLKPGMEKNKVRFILGTPLVTDVFHDQRWDYFFSLQKRGGERIQRRVSVFFKEDKLSHVEGNVKPGSAPPAASQTVQTTGIPDVEQQFLEALAEDEISTPASGSAPETAATAAAEPVVVPETEVPATTAATPAPAPQPPPPPRALADGNENDPAFYTRTGAQEVVIDENAPQPKKKGLLRKWLDKNIGDSSSVPEAQQMPAPKTSVPMPPL